MDSSVKERGASSEVKCKLWWQTKCEILVKTADDSMEKTEEVAWDRDWAQRQEQ